MTCDNHQFIRIDIVSKPDDKSYTPSSGGSKYFGRFIQGALVVCALCGEVRNVWPDGQIDIKKSPNTNVAL